MQHCDSLSSRHERLLFECPRCAGFHEGTDNDCSCCAICYCNHFGEHCVDAYVLKLCRRCGVQHTPVSSCPCPRCHRHHGDADCASVLRARQERPGVIKLELEVRCLPCSVCRVWHSPDWPCDHWSTPRVAAELCACVNTNAINAVNARLKI